MARIIPMFVLVERVAEDLGVAEDLRQLFVGQEVVAALDALGSKRDWYQTFDWVGAEKTLPPPPDVRKSGYWEGVRFEGGRDQFIQTVAGAVRLARSSGWHDVVWSSSSFASVGGDANASAWSGDGVTWHGKKP